MSSEIDYKLSVDLTGVIEVDETKSVIARINEWFDTPRGQVWGAPHWGNRLMQYKHEPINQTTAAAMENSIMLTLPYDVKNISIRRIEVIPKNDEIDFYQVRLVANGLTMKKDLNFE